MVTLHRPSVRAWSDVLVPASDPDYRDALAFVNSLRARFGHEALIEMRPGRGGDAEACPIAASLADVFPSVFVNQTTTRYACTADSAFLKTVRHPPSVGRFVSRVDAGYFPTLIVQED